MKTVFDLRVAITPDQVVSWSDHQTIVMEGFNEHNRDEPRCLYVRDARVHKDFYSRVLGFTTNIEDSNGQFVFMRFPNSSNHHDVAFFSVGGHASPSTAGRQSVGLYHIAWEVETLAELEETKKTLEREGPSRSQ